MNLFRRHAGLLLTSPRQAVAGSPNVLHDRFTPALEAGSLDGTDAQPGPGIRVVNDVENVLFTADGYLRGGSQPTSPVWGESRISWTLAAGAGIPRVNGRTLAVLFRPQDRLDDFALGWATAANIADPTADGYALVNVNGGLIEFTTNSVKVLFPPGGEPGRTAIRPMHYLLTAVMLDTGSALLLSTFGLDNGADSPGPIYTPAYPSARVLAYSRLGTHATLFPSAQFLDQVDDYYRGHMLADLRVLDVPDWTANDPLAILADRFERADSNTALGNSWTADIGVWGISSNAAYCVSGSGFRAAWREALADAIFTWTVTTPSSNQEFHLIFRRVSAGNYLRLRVNMTGGTIALQYVNAGVYGGEIMSSAVAFATSTTYQVSIYTAGNRYLILVNDVIISAWYTDAGSNHIAGTGAGFGSFGNDANSPRFNHFTVTPHTLTLPTALCAGAVPTVVTAGATLAQDTFTDTDATDLTAHTPESGGSWTSGLGTWTITDGKVAVDRAALSAGQQAFITQDLGVQDVECSVTITLPDPLVDNYIAAGILLRYTSVSSQLYFRLRRASAREIEVGLGVPGFQDVAGKVQFPTLMNAGDTYTLRVQIVSDVALVFLDDVPVLSYVVPLTVNGTRFGLTQTKEDSGCTFDNWIVKAL